MKREGPCDTLSCFLFALWLHRSQSILVQEIESAKDIDLTCSKTFPFKASTCLEAGPMSLDWTVDPITRFDQSRPSRSPEDPNDEEQRGALSASTRSSSPEDPIVDQQRGPFQASTRSRWRQDALQPPSQVPRVLQVGMDVAISLEFCGVLLGTPRGLVGSVLFQAEEQRIQT